MRVLILLTAVFAIAGAAAVLAVPAARPKPTHVHGTVWVVERNDTRGTLSAFDAATGEELGRMPVGRRPIGVVAPRGTGKVYTADERSDQLTVVTKDSFAAGAPVAKQIATGTWPHHMLASGDGDRLYFGEYGTNKVGVVDTDDDRLVAEYAAATKYPGAKTHAVWVTKDGKTLYATSEGAAQTSMGTVSKLDARTGALIWEVDIGVRPSEVLVTRDGRTAYVTVRNESKVKILDIGSAAPVQTGEVVIGPMPDTMQLTKDGTLVVGLRGIPQLALLDTSTLAVRHVTFAGYGISGHQWLSKNGKLTFIALEAPTLADPTRPGGIAVVRNDSAEVLAIWPHRAGPAPHGVFYESKRLRPRDGDERRDDEATEGEEDSD
jgi:DNA-binding beta-propeller fold protein YncE